MYKVYTKCIQSVHKVYKKNIQNCKAHLQMHVQKKIDTHKGYVLHNTVVLYFYTCIHCLGNKSL